MDPVRILLLNDVGTAYVTAQQALAATTGSPGFPVVIQNTAGIPVDTELPAATAMADADPNPTTSRIGADLLVFNGTTWDRARGNTVGLFVHGVTASDAPVNTAQRPLVTGGVASLGLPAAVSADNDVVYTWHYRTGVAGVLGPPVLYATAVGQSADVQLVGVGSGSKLFGFSARESGSPAAAATFVLRHGTLPTDTPVVFGELSADQSLQADYAVPREIGSGLFLDMIAGTIDISVHQRTIT